MKSMKLYSATKYGRMRQEVEREINARLGAGATVDKGQSSASEGARLAHGMSNTARSGAPSSLDITPSKQSHMAPSGSSQKPSFLDKWKAKNQGVSSAIKDDGAVFDDAVPDEEVEVALKRPAEALRLPDSGEMPQDTIIKLH